MDKLKEFPALEERLAYLDQALYAAIQQANDAARDGINDTAIQQRLVSIRAERRELVYVLAFLGRHSEGVIITLRQSILIGVTFSGLLACMVLLVYLVAGVLP